MMAWLSLVAACNRDWRGDAFEHEASKVAQALTRPEGAMLLERGTKSRDATYVEQSWELRTASDWQKYGVAIEGALRPDYGCVREVAAIWCTRWIPGDVFRLRIEARPDAGGLHIRAELRGGHD